MDDMAPLITLARALWPIPPPHVWNRQNGEDDYYLERAEALRRKLLDLVDGADSDEG
jgi:hypothetical protein